MAVVSKKAGSWPDRSGFLRLTVFLSGSVIMILEILGFRILAPFFGYSIYVWGNLLGLILGSLAIGYVLGGRLADRWQTPDRLYQLILGASGYLLILIFTYRRLMEFSAGYGPIAGSLIATAVMYGPPMVLLSTVSPYVIKLLAQGRSLGTVSGQIYGISTVGSLVGVFGGAFYLIPVWGSHRTLIFGFVMILLLAVAGLVRRSASAGLALLLLPAAVFAPARQSVGTVFEKDSLYFHIEVVKRGNLWTYYRDGAISSKYIEGQLLTGEYWDLFNLGPMLTDVHDILILGMGTGTTLRQYLAHTPKARIDAVELDPEVLTIAENYFGVEADARARIFVGDVRPFLRSSRDRYDFIEIDVYRRPLEIPFYVATREFFSAVRDHLHDSGLVMMNVAVDLHTEFMDRMVATIRSVFPSVYALQFKGNTILLAAAAEIPLSVLHGKLTEHVTGPLSVIAHQGLALADYTLPEGTRILTDDLAPVEHLTYRSRHRRR